MARWLCSTRHLWLLDEPVTALDDAGQQLLTDIIEEHIARSGVVIYSTHLALSISGKQQFLLQAADAEAAANA